MSTMTGGYIRVCTLTTDFSYSGRKRERSSVRKSDDKDKIFISVENWKIMTTIPEGIFQDDDCILDILLLQHDTPKHAVHSND
jgi:hypothetical protein